MTDYTSTTVLARWFWTLLLAVGIFYETITLPSGHSDTLSHFVIEIRTSYWRLLFLPSFLWLTFHWCFRKTVTADYKDLIVIGIGFVWAATELIIEHYKR